MKTIIKVKIKSMIAKPIAITTGIQIGEVTHHQDQSITPVNLRTKNTINNAPVTPLPVFESSIL